MTAASVQRRARPLLGTLVEIGLVGAAPGMAAFDAGFDAVAEVQTCLSRFEADSDVARFAALPAGEVMDVQPHTATVLALAQQLHHDSAGAFDVALGTGRWHCQDGRLHKFDAGVRLDLGGIGKGYAVDAAVAALQQAGIAAGWVNAGGDLRVFGDLAVPLQVRDEATGGTRAFGELTEGAFATSHYGAGSRSELHDRVGGRGRGHVSVAAPTCLIADALTKLVALRGDPQHPLLRKVGAVAWCHAVS